TLTSGSEDHTLRLWDFATGKTLLPDTGHTAPVVSVGISPDNKTVVSTSRDRTIRVWDVASGKETRRLEESAPIDASALAPNGRLLATASGTTFDRSGTLRLWDLDTGKPLHELSQAPGSPGLAFSPDSKTLAASDSYVAYFYDTVTGKESVRAGVPKGRRWGGFVAFSPDGKTFFWSDRDKYTCRVSETATGKELHRFRVHDDYGVDWGAFLDGQTLLLG